MSEASLAAALKAKFDAGFDDTTASSNGFAEAIYDNLPEVYAVGDLVCTTLATTPAGRLGYGTWSDLGAQGIIPHVWQRTA